jgi:hypothetical protein
MDYVTHEVNPGGGSGGAPRATRNARLIVELASGKSQRDAASEAGVSESTVYRRLKDPQFVEEVRAAQRGLVDRAIATLAGVTPEAAETMVTLMRSSTSEPIRLRAASYVIDLGRQELELAELRAQYEREFRAARDRLDALEDGAVE